MARTGVLGFELGHVNELFSTTGTLSVQSTTKRSGGYALRCNPTNASGYATHKRRLAGGAFASFVSGFRFYVYAASYPTTKTKIVTLATSSAALLCYVSMDSSGRLWNALNGSSFYTVPLDQWVRVEMVTENLSGGIAGWEMVHSRVDGVWKDLTTDWGAASYGGAHPEFRIGVNVDGTANATADLYFDDIAFDNDNSLNGAEVLGAGRAYLLKPTSDVSRGNWTAGAGGTTSLFAALDNVPPAGLATETNASQIENLTNALNQESTFSCQSAQEAYPGEATSIACMQVVANHGQSVTTGGAKPGYSRLLDPSGVQLAGNATFDYGDAVAGVGNFPSGWKTHFGNPVDNSELGTPMTVESNLRPVIAKNVASTRSTEVDFLGVYVDTKLAAPAGMTHKVPAMTESVSGQSAPGRGQALRTTTPITILGR